MVCSGERQRERKREGEKIERETGEEVERETVERLQIQLFQHIITNVKHMSIMSFVFMTTDRQMSA